MPDVIPSFNGLGAIPNAQLWFGRLQLDMRDNPDAIKPDHINAMLALIETAPPETDACIWAGHAFTTVWGIRPDLADAVMVERSMNIAANHGHEAVRGAIQRGLDTLFYTRPDLLDGANTTGLRELATRERNPLGQIACYNAFNRACKNRPDLGLQPLPHRGDEQYIRPA